MNRFKLNRKTVYVAFFILLRSALPAQTLTVNGFDWTVSLPAITEAGSNYNGTYESAANQILLNTTIPLLLGNGKVSVHYEANPTWHNDLILSVKRTGSGSTICALCEISGGLSYLPLTLADIELYRIKAVLALASFSNIPIQLRVSGVSVTIPAASYNSRVVFTVSAL
ncbi:hypothetical protein [Niabella aquatica]